MYSVFWLLSFKSLFSVGTANVVPFQI